MKKRNAPAPHGTFPDFTVSGANKNDPTYILLPMPFGLVQLSNKPNDPAKVVLDGGDSSRPLTDAEREAVNVALGVLKGFHK